MSLFLLYITKLKTVFTVIFCRIYWFMHLSKNYLLCERKLFVLFIILSPSYIFSQEKRIVNSETLLSKSYVTGNISNEKIIVQLYELYYLSKNEGNISGQIYSLYEQSRIFCEEGKFKQSLEKIAEGIVLAKKQKDYNMLCRLLLVYQKNLIRINKPQNSKSILAKSEECNKLNTSTAEKQINNIYILLAKARLMVNAENVTKDMSPIIALKRQAYSEGLKIDNSSKYKEYIVIFTLESLAWSLALAGKTSEADQLTEKIDELLKSYPDGNLIIENLVIKAAVSNMSGNHKTALKYLFMAKDESIKRDDSYRLYEIYPSISAAFGQIKDFKNSTAYSWEYNRLADSLNVEKGKINENFINKINAEIYQEEDNNSLVVVISVLAVLACILFFMFRKYRNYFIKYFSKKTKINPLTNNYNVANISDLEVENTKRLIRLVKEDINAFYIEFNKIYPDFYRVLKEQFSDLNMADVKFCALIKMNFEIKQISAYTNTSIRSVDSRRYRILKKMEVKNQEELYVILSKVH